MVAEQPVHPAKDQLIAFGQGKLGADESSSVEQHLEVCRECCETLLDLKDDTFVGLVRVTKPRELNGDRGVETLVQPDDSTGQRHPATDGGTAGADHAATVLLKSDTLAGSNELPLELAEHPRYRIVELIGRGGMGNVYRAEHRLMNRAVAIKLINSQLMQHPHAVERFRREVQAAAKLSHPNIVAAYDAEQAGNAHYLVMEFVEGTDLASVVNQRGPMSVAEACECMRQAAVGLQHAHVKGMVHRDIKPHNLMLAAGGQVRILDFGLAGFASEAMLDPDDSFNRHANGVRVPDSGTQMHAPTPLALGLNKDEHPAPHLTAIGSVMGTPDYMAPEQAADAHSADIRADIYSLGCTLYFLLTGKPPFEALTVVEKLKAHIEQAPPSLAELRDDLPSGLSNVIVRMMAKDPADRFQSPRDVAIALQPFTAESQSIFPTLNRKVLTRIAKWMLVPLMLAAGVVIYLATDTGRIEVDAKGIELPGAKVVLIKDGKEYATFDVNATQEFQSIWAGEYEVQLRGASDDVRMNVWTKRGDTNNWGAPDDHESKPIVLFRGGGLLVRVLRKETQQIAAATLERERPPVIDQPPVAASTPPDEQRLQGKWIAVSGHARKQPLTAAEVAQLSITFDGDRVEIVSHTGPATPQAATFTINPSRDPKQIDFVAPNQKEAMPGIYEFDGKRLKLALIDQDYSRPTNFDPDHRPDHLTVTLEHVPVAAALGQEEQTALKAAEAYLAVVDADKFDQLFDIGSNLAKEQATREQISQTYQTIRNTLGKLEKRTLKRVRLMDEFLGLPAGRYAAVQYVSDFEKLKGLWETVLLNVDDDGQWRVNTYAATVQPLPLPEPKKTSGPAASEKSQRPASPTPSAAVPTGANLIVDPSFENTAPTLLPRGWSAWLDDGPDFRCEVVEGGLPQGQRCLQIAGQGTRGVVFANVIEVDRSKRYTLKGWAKFEGEKDARAIIKFNYFKDNQFLGVHDLAGVTGDKPGWQLIEKTDSLDRYSDANKLYAMCHVEGNGTGWFDDLEVIAYDRDKLPIDFDSRHGRNNRLHGPNSLNRWVGTWETEYDADNSPKETKLAMQTVSERTLGDYFLLSHSQAAIESSEREAPPPGDLPANVAAVSRSERLLFLTFDQNLGAFRQWIFSSTGKTYESRGQWNDATQTLELRTFPDASNMFASERFVSADRIEVNLRQQFVMGSRDVGGWTTTRKAVTAKVDVPVAQGPAAELAELSLLNKLAGEWTIRETAKPSVWIANGQERTSTERVAWILHGKFLTGQTFDEQDRLTTVWLATWEPHEKSYRYWFFSAEGWSGQWRVTWDASSRAFHWRSIDMPTGWIGTAFNRWIDDDTFDNQALIKDEQGRVLMDSTQDKRRKKP